MSTFREKYLKYKMKYIQLKNQLGGVCECGAPEPNGACPKCGKSSASSSAAAGYLESAIAPPQAAASSSADAGDINVYVVAMNGDTVMFPISRDAKILQLKELIRAEDKFGRPEIYRQKLVYRPGRYGMEPLADRLTLSQCDIGVINNRDPIEVDLLFEPNLRPFVVGLNKQFLRLMKTKSIKELTASLSQYTGYLNLNLVSVDGGIGGLIEDADVIILAHALMGNTTVVRINLWFNRIGDAGARALADMLAVNRTLINIHLDYNSIGDEGACALATALKKNDTLTSIGLSNNRIGDEGAHCIADMMSHNSTIRQIHLEKNRYGKEGFAILDVVKQNRPRYQSDIFTLDSA